MSTTKPIRLRDVLPTKGSRALGFKRHNNGMVTVQHQFLAETIDYAMERGWQCPDPARIVAIGQDIIFAERPDRDYSGNWIYAPKGSHVVAFATGKSCVRVNKYHPASVYAYKDSEVIANAGLIRAFCGARYEVEGMASVFAFEGSRGVVGPDAAVYISGERGCLSTPSSVFPQMTIHTWPSGTWIETHSRAQIIRYLDVSHGGTA